MICFVWLIPLGGLPFSEGNLRRSCSGEEVIGEEVGEVNGRRTAVGINMREENIFKN